jgi:hypothetical protein
MLGRALFAAERWSTKLTWAIGTACPASAEYLSIAWAMNVWLAMMNRRPGAGSQNYRHASPQAHRTAEARERAIKEAAPAS